VYWVEGICFVPFWHIEGMAYQDDFQHSTRISAICPPTQATLTCPNQPKNCTLHTSQCCNFTP
jgi:hypothetical protein